MGAVSAPAPVVAKCPACGRRVALPRYRHAATVVRRSCRCGRRWAVKVVPVPVRVPGMEVHVAEFAEVSR